MPFNCRARIAVAPTSRSGQRAPSGASVPPGPAAAALRILRHRHHGWLGLQPAGREQVRLHPRYARRGLPGSATGPLGARGQAGRPGTGPGAGNPRGTRRAPALHGRLSRGCGDDRGAPPLPSQGSPRRRAALPRSLVGVGCAGPGRLGSGCFGRAAGRLGSAGAGCGEGDAPRFLHPAVFRVCSAHPNPRPRRRNTSSPGTRRGAQF